MIVTRMLFRWLCLVRNSNTSSWSLIDRRSTLSVMTANDNDLQAKPMDRHIGTSHHNQPKYCIISTWSIQQIFCGASFSNPKPRFIELLAVYWTLEVMVLTVMKEKRCDKSYARLWKFVKKFNKSRVQGFNPGLRTQKTFCPQLPLLTASFSLSRKRT